MKEKKTNLKFTNLMLKNVTKNLSNNKKMCMTLKSTINDIKGDNSTNTWITTSYLK